MRKEIPRQQSWEGRRQKKIQRQRKRKPSYKRQAWKCENPQNILLSEGVREGNVAKVKSAIRYCACDPIDVENVADDILSAAVEEGSFATAKYVLERYGAQPWEDLVFTALIRQEPAMVLLLLQHSESQEVDFACRQTIFQAVNAFDGELVDAALKHCGPMSWQQLLSFAVKPYSFEVVDFVLEYAEPANLEQVGQILLSEAVKERDCVLAEYALVRCGVKPSQELLSDAVRSDDLQVMGLLALFNYLDSGLVVHEKIWECVNSVEMMVILSFNRLPQPMREFPWRRCCVYSGLVQYYCANSRCDCGVADGWKSCFFDLLLFNPHILEFLLDRYYYWEVQPRVDHSDHLEGAVRRLCPLVLDWMPDRFDEILLKRAVRLDMFDAVKKYFKYPLDSYYFTWRKASQEMMQFMVKHRAQLPSIFQIISGLDNAEEELVVILEGLNSDVDLNVLLDDEFWDVGLDGVVIPLANLELLLKYGAVLSNDVLRSWYYSSEELRAVLEPRGYDIVKTDLLHDGQKLILETLRECSPHYMRCCIGCIRAFLWNK